MKLRLLLTMTAVAVMTVAVAADRVRVACVGNSVTYGATSADRAHTSYPAQLQRLLGAAYRRSTTRPTALSFISG